MAVASAPAVEAALAIAHVFRADRERVYRIEIPDEVEGVTEARLDRDHGRVLTWSLQDGVITAPARYAGQRVLGGFTSWAVANLSGEELEFIRLVEKAIELGGKRQPLVAAN